MWTQKISTRQVDRVISLTTVAAPWLGGQSYTLTAHIVYYTSVDRNALSSFITSVCCGLIVQLIHTVAAVEEFRLIVLCAVHV